MDFTDALYVVEGCAAGLIGEIWINTDQSFPFDDVCGVPVQRSPLVTLGEVLILAPLDD